MNPLWTAVVALGVAGAAWADDEVEVRQEQAERERADELKELRDRLDKVEKQQASAGQTWDASKMLAFSTADGNYTAKIGGRIYLNYRHLFDRDDVSGGDTDTIFLDTARFQLEGTFFKSFFYRVEGEAQTTAQTQTIDVDEGAGTSNVSVTAARGTFRMKDVYLGWNVVPDVLSIQGGQMKTPWSQEETCSSRFIDFAERSIINRLAPAHDTGVLAKLFAVEKILELNLGVFNGAIGRDTGRNAPDSNDEKDVVGRIFVTPFRNGSAGFLKGLRLGFDFTVGDRDDQALFGNLTTGDLGNITFNPFVAGSTADGLQKRYLGNFHWSYGPASLRAEYAVVNTGLPDAAASGDFEIQAAYVQATFLLTGEEKPLENRIKPTQNLNITEGGWGAFELAARLGRVDTSDGEDAGVVSPTAVQEFKEVTFGVNWWWSPNVAVRFNWERFLFDEDVLLGTGNDLVDTRDVFVVRWQVDF